MDRTSAPIVGLAVIAALAAGGYAYMMRGELTAQKAAVAAAEKKLGDFKRAADEAHIRNAAAQAAVAACNRQLADAEAKVAAMAQPATKGRR
jgi:hypothetical protein